MLFDGLPPEGSCEWQGLIPFVSAYNTRHGTAYTRQACVDVEIRDKPAPEVLLTSPGEPPIAIERKAIAWPQREHLAGRRKEQRFMERFVEAVQLGGGAFEDSIYRLAVGEESLRDRTKREVESVAESIASVVASRVREAKSQRGLAGTEPIVWRFGPMPAWERDETTPARGVGVIVWGRDPLGDVSEFLRQREVARAGYWAELQRASKAATAKFADFSDCRRLFLVQFFGDLWHGPTDEEILELIVAAPILENIDQVWVADHHWTNIDSYEIAWKRVR